LLAQIIRKQSIFDLVDRTLQLLSNLFETDPEQNGAADVISNNPGLSALAAFAAVQLLGFAVKSSTFQRKPHRAVVGGLGYPPQLA
jgi:hypothetical protein